MGRYPSIAADKQKTGAARGKLYAMYSKEIYNEAKKSTDLDANPTLKRLVEKASPLCHLGRNPYCYIWICQSQL